MRYGPKVSTSQPESGVECDAAIPIISERLSDGTLVNSLNFVVLQLVREVIEQDCRLPSLDNFSTFRDFVVGSAFGDKAECAGRPARSRWCKSITMKECEPHRPRVMRRCPRGHRRSVDRERIGQPLSRESTLIPGADVVPLTEGNTDGRDNASAQTARRGLRHWHVRTLFAREPGDLMVGQRHMRAALVRVGKARSRSR